jgi:hypothetical protein
VDFVTKLLKVGVPACRWSNFSFKKLADKLPGSIFLFAHNSTFTLTPTTMPPYKATKTAARLCNLARGGCGKKKKVPYAKKLRLNCLDGDIAHYFYYCAYAGKGHDIMSRILGMFKLNPKGFPTPRQGGLHDFVLLMEHLVCVAANPVRKGRATRSAKAAEDAAQRAFTEKKVEMLPNQRTAVQESCKATCGGDVIRLFDLAQVKETDPDKAEKAIGGKAANNIEVIQEFRAVFSITREEYKELCLHDVCDFDELNGLLD